MANTDISAAAAIAACNGIVDLLDGGTPPGLLRIYSGTKPADPDEAIGAQVLLAELTLANPAFGAAVDVSPGGRATASTITDDSSANNTGTAAWFRAVQGGGNTGVIDGDVTATGGGGDLQLNSVAIQSAAQVSITSWTFTVPQGA